MPCHFSKGLPFLARPELQSCYCNFLQVTLLCISLTVSLSHDFFMLPSLSLPPPPFLLFLCSKSCLLLIQNMILNRFCLPPHLSQSPALILSRPPLFFPDSCLFHHTLAHFFVPCILAFCLTGTTFSKLSS